ncbi:MAG TPA: hypothetical protein VFY16_11330, partial [Gemmatimonadaceae bacterium]|nr:hypothetical protein [Gemmatimonadaceae bacterium]
PRAMALALLALLPAAAHAQVRPDADWRTLHTPHLRVHFPRELEPLARRAAVDAETAWARLARELRPPRGPVDLVLTDEADFSNGSATTFPTNRVVIFAQPPVASAALRFTEDWLALVITHELAHVFHLDRARGWWGAAQHVFGRNPLLFPNAYLPAWITEGLAVHYESRLTGAGRVLGSWHPMYARAAAISGGIPRLDELSLATHRFPGGEVTYAYGGQLLDFIARTRGEQAVPRFVERTSRTPLPFLLNHDARRAFGEGFTDAWRRYRDSLAGLDERVHAPLPGWRHVAGPTWDLDSPRWLSDGALLVAVNPGRELPGAYVVRDSSAPRRLGRRNGVGRNVPLPDGALLYAQLDYLDPFRIRSDLWVQRGDEERRLTRGLRLSAPDARADGAIVAVQAGAGGTRLVRVTRDGGAIAPLTAIALDTLWTEPRWSPDGTRLAAVRMRRGAWSDVVVLDTLGGVIAVPASARAVSAAPAWSADGRRLVFSSDVTGRAELWEAPADASAPPRRLSATSTGLFQPDVSPHARLAAIQFRADGWELGVAPYSELATPNATSQGDGEPAASSSSSTPWPVRADSVAPATTDSGPVRRYSPWRTLLPRYWTPLVQPGDDDALLVGAFTSASDVVGRHAYSLQALVNTRTGDQSLGAAYRWAGFGQPFLDVAWSRDWDRGVVTRADGTVAGELAERTQVASLAATFLRPRFRTSSFVTFGAELETRRYSTEPGALLDALPPFYRSSPRYPAARISAAWSNVQVPTLAISAEDGVRLSGTARQRWLADDVAPATRSVVGQLAAYRAIRGLPGPAHHVLALRAVGGWSDDAATSAFDVGGSDAGTLELLPGLLLGDPAQTFAVRGFPIEAQEGNRAAAASLEWRAPLAIPGRGIGLAPLFLDRLSLTAFADAGSAWCSAGAIADRRPGCGAGRTDPQWLASAGAELMLDAAILSWDAPLRFRVGVAARVHGGSGTTAYVGVGKGF